VLIQTLKNSAHKSWESLQEFGDLLVPKSNNRADFIRECRDGNFEGVVAAYRTLASDSITGRFDEELVQVLPKSWAYISNCGISLLVLPS
jgi:glyoxylate reductase